MKKALLALMTCLLLCSVTYAQECVYAPEYVNAPQCVYAQECPLPNFYTRQGFYIGGLAGVNFMHIHSLKQPGIKHNKIDPGFDVGVFLGYKFCSCENVYLNLRVEGEFSYRRNHLKSFKNFNRTIKLHGYTDSFVVMGNAIYDIDLNSRFTPYIGIGAGYVHARVKNTSHRMRMRSESNGFGSKYIAGIDYRMTEDCDLGLRYSYLLARKHIHENSVVLTLKRFF
jgi:OmpA-OmpF porin, OOP family